MNSDDGWSVGGSCQSWLPPGQARRWPGPGGSVGRPEAGDETRRRRWLRVTRVCGLLFAIIGCGGAAEEEHEHLEHFVPAHKPATFEMLVNELTKRIAVVSDANSKQEFADIINWIPELAADSELRRADFDRAAAIGIEMNAAFARVADAMSSEVKSELTTHIAALQSLVPQSLENQP